MPRPCTICSDSRKLTMAAAMVAAGQSDRAIADALNALSPDLPPMSSMAVTRHRRAHIVAPARALADAANKGRDVVEQRAQVLVAAEAGDPAAFVALASIVGDLRKVHERLERTAVAAEQDGQRMTVAGLAAQQLRASEVRAKIGGVGGYASPRAGENGAPGAALFAVNIHFSGGRTESVIVEGHAAVLQDASDT